MFRLTRVYAFGCLIRTLYDVFRNIADDEKEHVKTMKACRDYSIVDDLAQRKLTHRQAMQNGRGAASLCCIPSFSGFSEYALLVQSDMACMRGDRPWFGHTAASPQLLCPGGGWPEGV